MRILFWDHYDAGMGGIEKLIITLAAELSVAHAVAVIARPGGIVAQTLRLSGATYALLDPREAGALATVTPDDLLIDFGTFPEFIRLAHANPHFVMWRVYPGIGCSSRLGTALFRRLFSRLEHKDSLLFMDPGCHGTACRELGLAYARRLLPLPIIERDKRYVARGDGGPLRFTYIGRGGPVWKVKPLKKLVADLSALSPDVFCVHVFTDTDERFRSELRDVQGANVEVEYHVGYTMERLAAKLVECADVHYSMGTACLEGAALGIPTLIADAANEDFPADYRYRWLVEDLENYAGGYLDYAQKGTHSIAAVVATARDVQALGELSDRTYHETVTRFSSKRIARDIEALRPQARVRDVLRFMPSYWMSGAAFGRHVPDPVRGGATAWTNHR